MTAIGSMTNELIDYAGLYPPASFDMPAAARSFLRYRRDRHASILGNFIVGFDRVEELRRTVGDDLHQMNLSVLATPHSDWACLEFLLDQGCRIETVEVKASEPAEIERIRKRVPSELAVFFEAQTISPSTEMLAAVAYAGARMKLRMGGVEPEAFPSPEQVAKTLARLVQRKIPFKATAGLHHPVRSKRRLAYESDSPSATMHGFMNLCCATSLLRDGGEPAEARTLLEEENPAEWKITADAISWRTYTWTCEQLAEMRAQSLTSFGSCSFEEPVNDLEALGWL